MTRLVNALTVNQVKSLKATGFYSDGHGLTLRVDDSGNKRWFQRITIDGKQHNIGIGSYPEIGLAEARNTALGNLATVRQGRNPIADKRVARATAKKVCAIPTFAEVAQQVIELRKTGWSNEKHAAQWHQSFAHVNPVLGKRRIDTIDTADILAVLEPIWTTTPTTASRIRQRMGHVFNTAMNKGYRTDNPADKAILSSLPVVSKASRHHDSIPYADVPTAYATIGLAGATESSKGALQFLILNGSRLGEVTGATWSEIDWESATWTIPAGRMKARKEHSVPLSTGALDVLKQAWERTGGEGLIFVGLKGKPISNRTIQLLLQRLEIRCTPHGFRSSIRDWTIEQTDADWTLGETVLAHRLGSSVESAYARTNMLEQRRELMQQWSDFVTG